MVADLISAFLNPFSSRNLPILTPSAFQALRLQCELLVKSDPSARQVRFSADVFWSPLKSVELFNAFRRSEVVKDLDQSPFLPK